MKSSFHPVSVEEGQKPKHGGGVCSKRCCVITSICVIVVLLVVAVAVIILFVVPVSERGTHGVSSKVVLDGGWSEWKPWTQCSKTCDLGEQSRQRDCSDPYPEGGGRECEGETQQTRSCADWQCPDCSRTCPQDATLVGCSYCKCPGSNVMGSVTLKGSRTPVSGVEVYISSRQWEPLGYTDVNGIYYINDLCSQGEMLSFKKEGYESEHDNYLIRSTGSVAPVEMLLLVKPRFTKHPDDTAAFVGQSATLVCEAVGTPDVTSYDWFKDGYKIDLDCTTNSCATLILNDVTTQDGGRYQCQAQSRAGKRFSNPANVIVKEEGDDFCSEGPLPKWVTLPPNCTVRADGVAQVTVDIGQCTPTPCVTSPPKAEMTCCGIVVQEELSVQCPGFEYSLMRAKQCGCTPCQVMVSDMVTIEGRVTMAARTPDGDYVTAPVPPNFSAEMTYDDPILGRQSEYLITKAEFSIAVTPIRGRVVLNFVADDYYDYLPHMSVVEVPQGVRRVRHHITLRPKHLAQGVMLNSSTENSISFAGGSGRMSIPKDSIAMNNGNLVTEDNIRFLFTYTDPKEVSSLALEPGTFTYEDDEGVVRTLQTYGVLGLSSGNRYFVNSAVELEVDPKALGIEDDDSGEPAAWVWGFDAESADWHKITQLSYGGGKGRVRRQRELATALTDIPHPLSYLNIDRPLLAGRECKVVVIMYQDKDMLQPAAGSTVEVYTRSSVGRYLGRADGVTDSLGRVCISVPCGYTHVITARAYWGAATPFPAEEQDVSTNIVYEQTDTTITFTSPRVEDLTENYGPVYRIKSYGSQCTPDMTILSHFRFLAPDVAHAGMLNAVELTPRRKLSWYQMPSQQPRRACMLRLRILSLADNTQVVGDSRLSDSSGDSFGTYTSSMLSYYDAEFHRLVENEYVACVQVKCPEEIHDEVSGTSMGVQDVSVKLSIAHPQVNNCTLKWTAVDPIYQPPDQPVSIKQTSITNISITVTLSQLQDFWTDAYMFDNTATGDRAYTGALRACAHESSGDLALFDCAQGHVQTGWWNSPPANPV